MSLIWCDGFRYYGGVTYPGLSYTITGGTHTVSTMTTRSADCWGFDLDTDSMTLGVAPAEARVIVGFAYQCTVGSAHQLLQFLDEDDTVHVTLGVDTSGKLNIYRGTSSGTLLDGPSSAGLVSGQSVYLEVECTVDDSDGEVIVYANDNEILSITGGDTKAGGSLEITQLKWTGTTNASIADLYVLDPADATSPYTRVGSNARVLVCPVQPNYNLGDWSPNTGTHASAVADEDGIDGDSTYITTGHRSAQIRGAVTAPSGASGRILGMRSHAVARKSGTGANRELYGWNSALGNSDDGTSRSWVGGDTNYKALDVVTGATDENAQSLSWDEVSQVVFGLKTRET